jgi:hypothetical protein
MVENPSTLPLDDPSCFNLGWMFGAQIGKDTTSNFTFSLNGLAVKTAANKYVVPVLEAGGARLIDVTCMTIGMDPYVWRLPVAFENVRPGQILVRADSPFALVFVERVSVEERRIHGIDPITDQMVDVVVPDRSIDVPSFLVRVVSLLDGFDGFGLGLEGKGGDGMSSMLPYLLCCGGAGGLNPNNNLLLALALSKGQHSGGNLLPMLLLLGSSGGQSNSMLQSLLLASALSDKGGLFGFANKRGIPAQLEGRAKKKAARK